MPKRNRRRGINPRDFITAQAEARVRYGPQRSTLNALLGEAEAQFKQEKRAARGAARSSIRMARRARAPLAAAYQQAVGRADVARADVEQAFGEIGAGADPFRAATARESALNRQQIADAAARANKELIDRQHEAAIGRQFALGAARQRYEADKSSVIRQLLDLQGQQGEYTTARLGALASERRKFRQTSREAARARRENRQTQLDVIAAADKAKEEGLTGRALGGGGAGGFEPASRSERRMFSTEFARALDVARDLKGSGNSRSQVAKMLRAGLPREEGEDKRGKFVNPAVSSIKDQLAMRAALDMAYKGYISEATRRRMREIGLRVDRTPRALSYDQFLRRKPGLAGRPVGTSGKAPF